MALQKEKTTYKPSSKTNVYAHHIAFMQNLTEWARLAEIKSELLEVAAAIEKDQEINRQEITAKLISLCKTIHHMENNIFEG